MATGALGTVLWFAPPAAGQQLLDYSVFGRVGAAGIDFNASPTLDSDRLELQGGSNPILFDTGELEQTAVAVDYREIYVGADGGLTSSEWEIDASGSARVASGALRAHVFAQDHRNASASYWAGSVAVGFTETLRYLGPPDSNGNYVVGFTIHLGPVSAENTQPPGFTFLWRGNAGSSLRATPEASGFRALDLGTRASFNRDCPSLDEPPCFGTSRAISSSGEVTIPASDPVLVVEHFLGITGRSADVNASTTATVEMTLPPGVEFQSASGVFLTEPVPEPLELGVLAAAGLLLAGLARRRGARAAR